jgi:pyridoxal phosphate enzyme (YggS family)
VENTLAERKAAVSARIAAACARSGRNVADVNVVAVTKYVGVEQTLEVVRQGLTNLGENRWQVAQDKWHALQGSEAVWHFIGTLQTNKVREVVGRFDYIHSLDRASLADAIEKQAAKLDIIVPCFLQVNVSGEDTKHGVRPEDLRNLASVIVDKPHIQPVGLMTMARIGTEGEETRPVFAGLRKLRDELNEAAILRTPMRELSMGMSADFEVAVEEGATWVRLGSVLVGHA